MAQQPAPAAVIAALQKDYPLPVLDPRWVERCIAELTAGEGDAASIQAVRECYLESNLATSTLPSAPLYFPTSETHNTIWFPTPTLLQIESITEIGASAFQLQTTLDQRRDVFQGVGKIKRMPDPTEDEDDGAHEDGGGEEDYEKLPPYPRGMLRIVVGDGRQRCRAIEFKRVQDFKLGETALGSKIQVQNVKVLHGMLLLTPSNTKVLYHSIPELQATQAKRFVASLRERMGKEPLSDEEEASPPPARPIAQPQSEAARAARRRAILGQTTSPPPAATKEEDNDSPPKMLSRFFALRGQPQAAQQTPIKKQQDSDAFSDFDVDEGILAQIDAVERGTRPASGTSRGDVIRRKSSPEIIEISSD